MCGLTGIHLMGGRCAVWEIWGSVKNNSTKRFLKSAEWPSSKHNIDCNAKNANTCDFFASLQISINCLQDLIRHERLNITFLYGNAYLRAEHSVYIVKRCIDHFDVA